MLTKIDRSEVPHIGNKPISEMRIFARETLKEFAETTKVGDIVEVTDFPVVCEDAIANVTKLMNAFRTESFYLDSDIEIKQFRRKGRVFLENKEPFRPKYINPNSSPLRARKETN